MAEKDRLCFKGISAAVGAVRDVLRSMDTVRGNDKPHGISLQAPYNAEAYPFAVYQYRHQLYESGCTEYGEVTPQDDLMERLLRARKG